MTPTVSQELTPRTQTAELRDAQVHAGAWTALLAAMVSLIAVQAPAGPVPSLAGHGVVYRGGHGNLPGLGLDSGDWLSGADGGRGSVRRGTGADGFLGPHSRFPPRGGRGDVSGRCLPHLE